jgi:hypothetical protein
MHYPMNKYLISFVTLILLISPLSAQKFTKAKVETVFLHSPTHIIPDLDELSMEIHPGNISMDESLSFLKNTSSKNREKFWASENSVDEIKDFYFSFPGYQQVDSSDFQIELIFDQLYINRKKLKKSNTTINGNFEDQKYTYSYILSGSFPCSVRASLNGNVLFEEDIFKKEDSFTYRYYGGQFGETFLDESSLYTSYDHFKDVIFTLMERDAFISAIMEAKRLIELNFLFAYYPQEFVIASAKGAKLDYNELDKAQFIAKAAFEKFFRDNNIKALLSNLKPAIDTWKKELQLFETEIDYARVDNKIAAMLCNNLSICELYASNFELAEKYLLKTTEYGKPNRYVAATEELLRQFKQSEGQYIDISSIGTKIIHIDSALGYKSTPNITLIGESITLCQYPSKTKVYQDFISSEK